MRIQEHLKGFFCHLRDKGNLTQDVELNVLRIISGELSHSPQTIQSRC